MTSFSRLGSCDKALRSFAVLKLNICLEAKPCVTKAQ